MLLNPFFLSDITRIFKKIFKLMPIKCKEKAKQRLPRVRFSRVEVLEVEVCCRFGFAAVSSNDRFSLFCQLVPSPDRKTWGRREGRDKTKRGTKYFVIVSFAFYVPIAQQSVEYGTGCPICSWTRLGRLDFWVFHSLPNSNENLAEAAGQLGKKSGTPKSKSTQPRSTSRWITASLKTHS